MTPGIVERWLETWALVIRLRERDVLAPLTWPQWCAWQAWAVCGRDLSALRLPLVRQARLALLGGLLDNRWQPKRDPRVPTLTEAALMRALDDECQLRLWLNYYINGRSLSYLAERHRLSEHGVIQRLANSRRRVAQLLPAEAIGYDIACGQTRLTLA